MKDTEGALQLSVAIEIPRPLIKMYTRVILFYRAIESAAALAFCNGRLGTYAGQVPYMRT